MPYTIFRTEVGDSVALRADVLMGDVLVNYVNMANGIEETNMNKIDCLTVSLWITGLNGTDTFRQL